MPQGKATPVIWPQPAYERSAPEFHEDRDVRITRRKAIDQDLKLVAATLFIILAT